MIARIFGGLFAALGLAVDWVNRRVTVTLPTWQQIAVTVALVALARGWYDAERKYDEMLDVALAGRAEVIECEVALRDRASALEERVRIAEQRYALLYAWLTQAGVTVPELRAGD